MKTIIVMFLATALVRTPTIVGQATPPGPVPARNITSNQQGTDGNLVRFDLDYPGGTPGQLVEAIEKASGKPLNAIIPYEFATVNLPQLRMKSVTVPELFDALRAASSRAVTRVGGYSIMRGPGTGSGLMPQVELVQTSYGFETTGTRRDNTVWHFFINQPLPVESKGTRFWQLAPYLETYTVEDITTAIQTAWKMLGEKTPPTMSFHKETKLLIAVGDQGKLQLIDTVLEQLSKGIPQPQSDPSAPKSGEAKKP